MPGSIQDAEEFGCAFLLELPFCHSGPGVECGRLCEPPRVWVSVIVLFLGSSQPTIRC